MTCSALTAGVMALGVALGEVERGRLRVLRMIGRMPAGGDVARLGHVRMILLGDGTLAEFVAHYHCERDHQAAGTNSSTIRCARRTVVAFRRWQPLGGLLNYYDRAA